MKRSIFKTALLGALLLVTASVGAFAQVADSQWGGSLNAAQFNQWRIPVDIGNPVTGTSTITLYTGAVSLPDGRLFSPFNGTLFPPITINDGANTETVTPSSASGCSSGQLPDTCTITASFANVHGRGATVVSGTNGLGEAIIAANAFGGGVVVVDNTWGGSNSTITGLTLATPKVWVQDQRGPGPIGWCGKSGTGAAAYSCSNNDFTFQVTLASGTATKTLSQTYATAPNCTGGATSGGTFTGVLKVSPTTSTVVVTSSVGTDTGVINLTCNQVK